MCSSTGHQGHHLSLRCTVRTSPILASSKSTKIRAKVFASESNIRGFIQLAFDSAGHAGVGICLICAAINRVPSSLAASIRPSSAGLLDIASADSMGSRHIFALETHPPASPPPHRTHTSPRRVLEWDGGNACPLKPSFLRSSGSPKLRVQHIPDDVRTV
jgi:hypothetical protein